MGRRNRSGTTQSNPVGSPSVAERTAALLHAQKSHAKGKRPSGGKQLVLPGIIAKRFGGEHPSLRDASVPLLGDVEWPDTQSWECFSEMDEFSDSNEKENEVLPHFSLPPPDDTQNATPQDSGVLSEAFNPLNTSTTESDFNSSEESGESVGRKISSFLNHVTKLKAPQGASKQEVDELDEIINLTAETFGDKLGLSCSFDTASKEEVAKSESPTWNFLDESPNNSDEMKSSSSTSQDVSNWIQSLWSGSAASNSSSSSSGPTTSKLHKAFESLIFKRTGASTDIALFAPVGANQLAADDFSDDAKGRRFVSFFAAEGPLQPNVDSQTDLSISTRANRMAETSASTDCSAENKEMNILATTETNGLDEKDFSEISFQAKEHKPREREMPVSTLMHGRLEPDLDTSMTNSSEAVAPIEANKVDFDGAFDSQAMKRDECNSEMAIFSPTWTDRHAENEDRLIFATPETNEPDTTDFLAFDGQVMKRDGCNTEMAVFSPTENKETSIFAATETIELEEKDFSEIAFMPMGLKPREREIPASALMHGRIQPDQDTSTNNTDYLYESIEAAVEVEVNGGYFGGVFDSQATKHDGCNTEMAVFSPAWTDCNAESKNRLIFANTETNEMDETDFPVLDGQAMKRDGCNTEMAVFSPTENRETHNFATSETIELDEKDFSEVPFHATEHKPREREIPASALMDGRIQPDDDAVTITNNTEHPYASNEAVASIEANGVEIFGVFDSQATNRNECKTKMVVFSPTKPNKSEEEVSENHEILVSNRDKDPQTVKHDQLQPDVAKRTNNTKHSYSQTKGKTTIEARNPLSKSRTGRLGIKKPVDRLEDSPRDTDVAVLLESESVQAKDKLSDSLANEAAEVDRLLSVLDPSTKGVKSKTIGSPKRVPETQARTKHQRQKDPMFRQHFSDSSDEEFNTNMKKEAFAEIDADEDGIHTILNKSLGDPAQLPMEDSVDESETLLNTWISRGAEEEAKKSRDPPGTQNFNPKAVDPILLVEDSVISFPDNSLDDIMQMDESHSKSEQAIERPSTSEVVRATTPKDNAKASIGGGGGGGEEEDDDVDYEDDEDTLFNSTMMSEHSRNVPSPVVANKQKDPVTPRQNQDAPDPVRQVQFEKECYSDIDQQSDAAVLAGRKPLSRATAIDVNVDDEQWNRLAHRQSVSSTVGSPVFVTPKARNYRPPNERENASDPVRQYWRSFSSMKALGSFDSTSAVDDSDGVVSSKSREGMISGRDSRQKEESVQFSMLESRKKNDPENSGIGWSSSTLTPPKEDPPKTVSDFFLDMMSPLLSGETAEEDLTTMYSTTMNSEETEQKAESAAAEKARSYRCLCGDIELSVKGFFC